MIALSASGAPSNARYNAVWVRRPGGAWLAFHGVRDADYRGRAFDQAVASGLARVLVSATGVGSSTVFAAVFEAGVPGPWMARHGLDRARLEAANSQAVLGGMALRSMTVYGAAPRRATPRSGTHDARACSPTYAPSKMPPAIKRSSTQRQACRFSGCGSCPSLKTTRSPRCSRTTTSGVGWRATGSPRPPISRNSTATSRTD